MQNNLKSRNEDLLAEKLTANIFLVSENYQIFTISSFLDEKEKFYAQKKINEEKWRERTMVIENLEEKLAHFSAQKQQKEDELYRDISDKEKTICDLQNEIAEKEKSHKGNTFKQFSNSYIVEALRSCKLILIGNRYFRPRAPI